MTDSTDFRKVDFRQIPSEEDERPVRIFSGIVLANDAYHCRPKHLWPNDISQAKPEWIPPMELYLANFCKPIRTIADEIRCVACDEQVTGHHVGVLDYRVRGKLGWSEEGTKEGRCLSCGYPMRMRHQIFMPDDGPRLVDLNGFPLFYHPSATQNLN